MTDVFKWNAPLASLADSPAAGFEKRVRFYDPVGVKSGLTKGLPIASGYVLKKGTPLAKSGAAYVPLPCNATNTSLVFDGDITGTATKKVVLTAGGLTITSATNVLHWDEVYALLHGAVAGTTGAALLATYNAASSVDDFTSVSGTLTGYNIAADKANKTLLFVSTAFRTTVASFTVTCVDTDTTPVDLISHITATTTVFGTDVISGILHYDVDTTAESKNAPVLIDNVDVYDNYLVLGQDPAFDTIEINGTTSVCTLYAAGIYNRAQLDFVFAGTEFNVRGTGTDTTEARA